MQITLGRIRFQFLPPKVPRGKVPRNTCSLAPKRRSHEETRRLPGAARPSGCGVGSAKTACEITSLLGRQTATGLRCGAREVGKSDPTSQTKTSRTSAPARQEPAPPSGRAPGGPQRPAVRVEGGALSRGIREASAGAAAAGGAHGAFARGRGTMSAPPRDHRVVRARNGLVGRRTARNLLGFPLRVAAVWECLPPCPGEVSGCREL